MISPLTLIAGEVEACPVDGECVEPCHWTGIAD